MNIPAFNAAARLASAATSTVNQHNQPRAHQGQPVQHHPTSPESVDKQSTARPVIELSDASLVRRDVPRGSLIDIVA